MNLELLYAHLPPLENHILVGDQDRGPGYKTVRILFVGVSGGDADGLDVPPEEQQVLWEKATGCLSQILDAVVNIYLLADPDRRAIIHDALSGGEEVRGAPEIDYFNAEIEKKAGTSLDPERLLQCRADYLRLDDMADELDEATMDRLRQDEAAYRRRIAQGAGVSAE